MLTNCAMMSCANQVEAMSLYEYEERLFHWNEAHALDGDVDAPDPEIAMAILEKIRANPAMVN